MFLSEDELNQVATYPHIHKLTITHEKLPQWPIELVYNLAHPNTQVQNVANFPPITVRDILLAVHRELQRPIVQYDFASLNSAEEVAVTRAFKRRCRSLGPQSERQLISEGVKRCDFLMKDVMFRGLVRTGDSLEKLRLVTGPA